MKFLKIKPNVIYHDTRSIIINVYSGQQIPLSGNESLRSHYKDDKNSRFGRVSRSLHTFQFEYYFICFDNEHCIWNRLFKIFHNFFLICNMHGLEISENNELFIGKQWWALQRFHNFIYFGLFPKNISKLKSITLGGTSAVLSF